VEGRRATGTEGREQQRALLASLWAVLDPALDALPAVDVPGHIIRRICTGFEASAAALSVEGGERFGTPPGDPAWPAAVERIELEVQDGLGTIGRLELAFDTAGTIGEDERAGLELAAARLGRAVARMRHEREAAVAEARLRAETHAAGRLYRISTALMAERELQDIVQRVTEETTALAGAQFGAFFYNVIDDRGESFMLYTIAGAPRSAFEQFPMPRNTAVFDPTFRGEGVVRSPDITADPRYGRSAPYHGMPDGHLPVRSYLAVPVRSRGGEVLGGLFFGHEATAVFDEEAERQVETVASLAALAIENARLHDTARRELEATKRAYNERDSVARVLQESLLPHRLPEIPGLEVAARYVPGEGIVGGDFYDVFPIGPGVFGAAIADVQGKDARAAAMTSVVRHTLRSAAQQHAGPSAALRHVDEVVRQEQDVDDPRFASAAFVLLEPRDGEAGIRLSSAGHPPALVLRAGGRVEECHFPGTLLGVAQEPELGDAVCSLGRGDALVLYTDGLIEARAANGDMLGEERVARLLAGEAGATADELATRLEQLAESYGAGRRRDDLALLVVRVPG
jgi:serine phosphatase RsbU (regulator of sigma subunit)